MFTDIVLRNAGIGATLGVELGAERVDDDIEIIAIIEKCVTEMEKYSSTDIILESFVKKEEPPAPAENAEEKKGTHMNIGGRRRGLNPILNHCTPQPPAPPPSVSK